MTGSDIPTMTITALLFSATFISGALLSHFIKPGNVLLLTAHKLVSLMTAISTAVTIYNLVSLH